MKRLSKEWQKKRCVHCPKHHNVKDKKQRLINVFTFCPTIKQLPPSFSVIMEFREDKSEVTYEDADNKTTIPPRVACDDNELYDPFSGTCRTIYCRVGYIFTEVGWV